MIDLYPRPKRTFVQRWLGDISEVTARFTLDALPGKQMAIDADLNAGLIDEKEALRRVNPERLNELLHPVFDPAAMKKARSIAHGLPADWPAARVERRPPTCPASARSRTASLPCSTRSRACSGAR